MNNSAIDHLRNLVLDLDNVQTPATFEDLKKRLRFILGEFEAESSHRTSLPPVQIVDEAEFDQYFE